MTDDKGRWTQYRPDSKGWPGPELGTFLVEVISNCFKIYLVTQGTPATGSESILADKKQLIDKVKADLAVAFDRYVEEVAS